MITRASDERLAGDKEKKHRRRCCLPLTALTSVLIVLTLCSCSSSNFQRTSYSRLYSWEGAISSGDKALELGALAEAAQNYESAIVVTTGSDSLAMACAIAFIRKARCCMVNHNPDQAQSALDSAVKILRRRLVEEHDITSQESLSLCLLHTYRKQIELANALGDLTKMANGAKEIACLVNSKPELLRRAQAVVELNCLKTKLSGQNIRVLSALDEMMAKRSQQQDSLNISSKARQWSLAVAAIDKANDYVGIAKRQEALSEYRIALDLSRQIEDRELEIAVLTRMARVLLSLDREDQAIANLEQALSIARLYKANNSRIQVLHSYLETEPDSARNENLLLELESLLARDGKAINDPFYLREMAHQSLRNGNLKDARAWALRAREACTKEEDNNAASVAKVELLLGRISTEEQDKEAIVHYQNVLKLLNDNGGAQNNQIKSWALAGIARIHAMSGQFEEAIKELEQSIALTEDRESIKKAHFYSELARVCFDSKHYELAKKHIQRGLALTRGRECRPLVNLKWTLARTFILQNKTDEAKKLLMESLVSAQHLKMDRRKIEKIRSTLSRLQNIEKSDR